MISQPIRPDTRPMESQPNAGKRMRPHSATANEFEQLKMAMMHRQSGGNLQTGAGHKTAFPQLHATAREQVTGLRFGDEPLKVV